MDSSPRLSTRVAVIGWLAVFIYGMMALNALVWLSLMLGTEPLPGQSIEDVHGFWQRAAYFISYSHWSRLIGLIVGAAGLASAVFLLRRRQWAGTALLVVLGVDALLLMGRFVLHAHAALFSVQGDSAMATTLMRRWMALGAGPMIGAITRGIMIVYLLISQAARGAVSTAPGATVDSESAANAVQ